MKDRMNWTAAIISGLVAGLVFVALEMIMVPLFLDGSPWGPPRMIAAIVLGEGVLPPPATFDLGMFITAVLVHMVLSIVYAVILAVLIRGREMGAKFMIGAAFGLVLYVVNFYVFTLAFPWFSMARNPVTIFSHFVFGIVAALLYQAIVRKQAVSKIELRTEEPMGVS